MNASQLWPTVMCLCVACGSSFQASDGATGGAVGAGGSGVTTGGAVGAGGSGSTGNGQYGGGAGDTGGTTTAIGGSSGDGSSAGASTSGGASTGGGRGGGTGVGGTRGVTTGGSAGTDGSTGGSAGSSAGFGGAIGSGGSTGGSGGTGGSSTPDCTTLENTYLTDLAKARICDPSAKAECSVGSTLPGSCGCPVLVAAGTAATLRAKSDLNTFNSAGCRMVMCPVACIQYVGAACVLDASSNAHMCTGS